MSSRRRSLKTRGTHSSWVPEQHVPLTVKGPRAQTSSPGAQQTS